MARAMNVKKRAKALRHIVARTKNHAKRAEKIANDLDRSFAKDETPRGKNARWTARLARQLSQALAKASASIKP